MVSPNEFRLHTSLRYRLNLVLRSLFRPRVWRWLNLPDKLFPLYALLSPFEFVSFHARTRWQRLSHAPRPRPNTQRKPLTFRRVRQLAPADVALAAEAAFMLTFFRTALKFLPVQRLTGWMDRYVEGAIGCANECDPDDRPGPMGYRRCSTARPFYLRLFPSFLAAYFMLHRRHIASKLFYGVAQEPDQLKAHTWVKVGDCTVVGGEVESQFTVLHTFP